MKKKKKIFILGSLFLITLFVVLLAIYLSVKSGKDIEIEVSKEQAQQEVLISFLEEYSKYDEINDLREIIDEWEDVDLCKGLSEMTKKRMKEILLTENDFYNLFSCHRSTHLRTAHNLIELRVSELLYEVNKDNIPDSFIKVLENGWIIQSSFLEFIEKAKELKD